MGSLVVVALAVLACGALSACSGVPEPVVDMTGVDHAQYNRDVADCYEKMPAFAFGNPVTTCLERKGYKILVIR